MKIFIVVAFIVSLKRNVWGLNVYRSSCGEGAHMGRDVTGCLKLYRLVAGNAGRHVPFSAFNHNSIPFHIRRPRRVKALTSHYQNWASVELYQASRRKSSNANG